MCTPGRQQLQLLDTINWHLSALSRAHLSLACVGPTRVIPEAHNWHYCVNNNNGLDSEESCVKEVVPLVKKVVHLDRSYKVNSSWNLVMKSHFPSHLSRIPYLLWEKSSSPWSFASVEYCLAHHTRHLCMDLCTVFLSPMKNQWKLHAVFQKYYLSLTYNLNLNFNLRLNSGFCCCPFGVSAMGLHHAVGFFKFFVWLFQMRLKLLWNSLSIFVSSTVHR